MEIHMVVTRCNAGSSMDEFTIVGLNNMIYCKLERWLEKPLFFFVPLHHAGETRPELLHKAVLDRYIYPGKFGSLMRDNSSESVWTFDWVIGEAEREDDYLKRYEKKVPESQLPWSD